jgi:sterol desaturase/sphingolipid hydroxylase (fatty acid hydroxylase superfamily)
MRYPYLPIINLLIILSLELFILNPNFYAKNDNTSIYHFIYAILSFIVCDFFAYVIHFYFHKIKFLYKKIHSIHHENYQTNFLSTIYMHPIEIVSFHFLYRLPMILGVPFTLVSFYMYQFILIIWTFLDHGFDFSIFSHHFYHHRFLLGNYSTCFSLWDILFDTVIPRNN